MPVFDASALTSYLTGDRAASEVREVLEGDEARWAPHLIDAEVGHSLRRKVARDELAADAAMAGLRLLAALPLERAPHGLLMDRAWDLRQNVSFYDGLYVALAEAMELPLYTLDARLARAPSLRAEIRVLGA